VLALPLPTEIVVAAGAVGNVLVALTLFDEPDEAEAVTVLATLDADFVPGVQTVFVRVKTEELQD